MSTMGATQRTHPGDALFCSAAFSLESSQSGTCKGARGSSASCRKGPEGTEMAPKGGYGVIFVRRLR